jgi:iron complex outermembrane receptor protein
LTYRHDIGNWGTFGVKSDTTYNRHERVDGTEFIGLETGSPNWKWRSVLTLDWTRGDWDASWTARYTSALEENGGCNRVTAAGTPKLRSLICNHPNDVGSQPNLTPGLGFNRIGAVVYNDVQLGWKAPWKAHLSIGARNVFGKEPPFVSAAGTFANSFDASYDLPGGPFYYFQYRQDF